MEMDNHPCSDTRYIPWVKWSNPTNRFLQSPRRGCLASMIFYVYDCICILHAHWLPSRSSLWRLVSSDHGPEMRFRMLTVHVVVDSCNCAFEWHSRTVHDDLHWGTGCSYDVVHQSLQSWDHQNHLHQKDLKYRKDRKESLFHCIVQLYSIQNIRGSGS